VILDPLLLAVFQVKAERISAKFLAAIFMVVIRNVPTIGSKLPELFPILGFH
jgi:hypothetical protein